MTKLAGSITELIVLEHGVDGLLSRVSDPFWFQSLGCVLGFDWHSSGVTTTTCGAIKEGIKGMEEELGLSLWRAEKERPLARRQQRSLRGAKRQASMPKCWLMQARRQPR
jgi:hypothetical protein